MIQVQNLTKTFRDQKRGVVRALDHVSFDVRRGEIFGILGPNGAGKTTALRLLATVLAPSEGTAQVAGCDIVSQPERVRKQIGFLSGEMGLYARLTPREILAFFARLHDAPSAAPGESLDARLDRVIAQFEMRAFADTKIDRLSTGMKQKVAIARAIIHDPPVLILDEPTYGLDVPTSRLIENFILDARERGKAIVLSTHVMEEAEYLCDRIAVIHEGRVRVIGTMQELRAHTGKQRLREIFLDLLGLKEDARRATA